MWVVQVSCKSLCVPKAKNIPQVSLQQSGQEMTHGSALSWSKGSRLQLYGKMESGALWCMRCLGKSETIARTLIEGGASLTTCFQGHPVLHDCLIAGWVEVAENMVAKGACLFVLDHRGKSSLHQAAGFKKPQCVEWLLQNGLGPLLEVFSGDAPLSLAKEQRLYQGVAGELLEEV